MFRRSAPPQSKASRTPGKTAGGRTGSTPTGGTGPGQVAPFRGQDLEHRLERLFTSQDYKPPRLPEGAVRVLELGRKEEVRIEEIHQALESDSLLVAAVLRVVRSPLYGRGDVSSLRDALVRLGLQRIRDIVMEVATSGKLFNAPGYSGTLTELQRHNRAVAHIVRVVGKAAQIDSESAFLCGLLHDVGTMALLAIVGGDSDCERPPLDRVLKAIRPIHASASARVAKLWGLPDPVVEVLAVHHHQQIEGPLQRLAAAVAVAEAISVQLGAGAPPFVDPVDRAEVEMAVKRLALPMATLDDIAHEAQSVLAAL